MGTIIRQTVEYTGQGTPNTWGEINGTLSEQTDLQTVLDTKQLVAKSYQQIYRTGVTASAGGSVRIPASGTDSRISTSATCVVRPICDPISDRPAKFKTFTISSGYATIVMAEAISNVNIGVEVINY